MEQYIIKTIDSWTPPPIPENIPHGDMPGDKVKIEQRHVELANVIFPNLLREIKERFEKLEKSEGLERLEGIEGNPEDLREELSKLKFVVSVYGGSGVGKSEVASLLSYYFNQLQIGSYTLSGDNYPHRIPKENDAKRLRVFTEGGETSLENYLGTDNEINFEEVSNIIKEFKAKKEQISLKRMGREPSELWYDLVDFSKINVLILEWTHGNNKNLQGVDFPIFLSSTPAETLAHRKARNRDGAVDSEFTTLVLNIEQKLLESQAGSAKMILTKQGGIVDYSEYV